MNKSIKSLLSVFLFSFGSFATMIDFGNEQFSDAAANNPFATSQDFGIISLVDMSIYDYTKTINFSISSSDGTTWNPDLGLGVNNPFQLSDAIEMYEYIIIDFEDEVYINNATLKDLYLPEEGYIRFDREIYDLAGFAGTENAADGGDGELVVDIGRAVHTIEFGGVWGYDGWANKSRQRLWDYTLSSLDVYGVPEPGLLSLLLMGIPLLLLPRKRKK